MHGSYLFLCFRHCIWTLLLNLIYASKWMDCAIGKSEYDINSVQIHLIENFPTFLNHWDNEKLRNQYNRSTSPASHPRTNIHHSKKGTQIELGVAPQTSNGFTKQMCWKFYPKAKWFWVCLGFYWGHFWHIFLKKPFWEGDFSWLGICLGIAWGCNAGVWSKF